MNEIIIRTTLKTQNTFNTGFLWIKDNQIEGIFTFDYVKIIIFNKKLSLHIFERLIFFDEEDILHDEFNLHCYSSTYLYDNLFAPDEYILFDKNNNILTMSLLEPVTDKFRISSIKNLIEQSR